MSAATTAHSVVEPTPRARGWSPASSSSRYALVSMIPLLWIFATGFKTPPDSISYPPKLLFSPTLEGYVNLFTTALAPDARIHGQRCRRPRPGTTSWSARATW